MMRSVLGRGSIALSLLLADFAYAAPDRIYLVRHAEKGAVPADDPGLSAAGRTRARQLASVLSQAGVEVIVVSDTRRSRETAAPLAESLKLHPQVAVGSGAVHLDAVMDRVQAQRGGVMLVVGHSNTLAPLVHRLGGPPLADLDECEFDVLWSLQLKPGLAFVAERYGLASSGC